MRLIVAIHDISPARLAHAQILRAMVARIAPGPVSLLVIPRRGGDERWGDLPGQAWLARRAAEGDEIVLHGWTHTTARGRDGAETRPLDAAAVGALVARGAAELRALGLGPAGFIAPAYGRAVGLDDAVSGAGLAWWAGRGTLGAAGRRESLPSVGLGASTATRRALSPAAARMGAAVLARCPVLRLDLHTADVEHPRLLAHGRALAASLCGRGRALTTHSRVMAVVRHEGAGVS